MVVTSTHPFHTCTLYCILFWNLEARLADKSWVCSAPPPTLDLQRSRERSNRQRRCAIQSAAGSKHGSKMVPSTIPLLIDVIGYILFKDWESNIFLWTCIARCTFWLSRPVGKGKKVFRKIHNKLLTMKKTGNYQAIIICRASHGHRP